MGATFAGINLGSDLHTTATHRKPVVECKRISIQNMGMEMTKEGKGSETRNISWGVLSLWTYGGGGSHPCRLQQNAKIS